MFLLNPYSLILLQSHVRINHIKNVTILLSIWTYVWNNHLLLYNSLYYIFKVCSLAFFLCFSYVIDLMSSATRELPLKYEHYISNVSQFCKPMHHLLCHYYNNKKKPLQMVFLFVWFPISVKLNILLATVTNTLEFHMCRFSV